MSDSYYDGRLSTSAYREARRRKAGLVYAVCADRLAEAEIVVDLGAGTGILKDTLERLSGRPIVGFEIDAGFIEDPTRMAVADLLRLPLAGGRLDFGIANHVYEHVADLDRFFAEIARALAPAGSVYLTAGSRFAWIEPHYRIPTLSWWPEPVASQILRWTGRGESYDDIRFTTHRTLRLAARRHGLDLDDRTDEVLATQLDRYESQLGRAAGRLARLVPAAARQRLLAWVSPQWFFFVHHAERST